MWAKPWPWQAGAPLGVALLCYSHEQDGEYELGAGGRAEEAWLQRNKHDLDPPLCFDRSTVFTVKRGLGHYI